LEVINEFGVAKDWVVLTKFDAERDNMLITIALEARELLEASWNLLLLGVDVLWIGVVFSMRRPHFFFIVLV
jgi:hypothetical protein